MQVSALFPVFAVLERQTKGTHEGSIDARLAPVAVWVTESRLAGLRGIVSGILASTAVPEGKKCALVNWDQQTLHPWLCLTRDNCHAHCDLQKQHMLQLNAILASMIESYAYKLEGTALSVYCLQGKSSSNG